MSDVGRALREAGFALRPEFVAELSARGVDDALRAAISADFRRVGLPRLPAAGLQEREVLAGPCVLQVMDAADVSRSAADRAAGCSAAADNAGPSPSAAPTSSRARMLKLLLTDGASSVVALEHVPCGALDGVCLGGKVRLSNAPFRRGMLVLHPAVVTPLGGALLDLQVAAEALRVRESHRLSGSRAQLPPHVQAVLMHLDDTGEPHPPHQQRQQADGPGLEEEVARGSLVAAPVAAAATPPEEGAVAAAPQRTLWTPTPPPSLTSLPPPPPPPPSPPLDSSPSLAAPRGTLAELLAPHSRPTIQVHAYFTDIVSSFPVDAAQYSLMVCLDDGTAVIHADLGHEVLLQFFGVPPDELRALHATDAAAYSECLQAAAAQLASLGPQLVTLESPPASRALTVAANQRVLDDYARVPRVHSLLPPHRDRSRLLRCVSQVEAQNIAPE